MMREAPIAEVATMEVEPSRTDQQTDATGEPTPKNLAEDDMARLLPARTFYSTLTARADVREFLKRLADR